MASTYLNLTNRLLRKLNEVEIAEADFNITRGVQSLAKDAIRDAIAQINQAEYEWPFNAAQHTQLLEVGQEEYSWPTTYKIADWNTFQLLGNTSLNVEHKMLNFLDRDVYFKYHKDTDDKAGATGLSHPRFVAPSHGNGYIVSPSPDREYTVQFKYYMNNVGLVNANDATRIPEVYENVILDGAIYYMYMFRDNPESAGVAVQVFQQGIKNMQSILINKYENVYDTRVSKRLKSGKNYIGL
mgnify:FL=1|jgi:hypothetical protein